MCQPSCCLASAPVKTVYTQFFVPQEGKEGGPSALQAQAVCPNVELLVACAGSISVKQPSDLVLYSSDHSIPISLLCVNTMFVLQQTCAQALFIINLLAQLFVHPLDGPSIHKDLQ